RLRLRALHRARGQPDVARGRPLQGGNVPQRDRDQGAARRGLVGIVTPTFNIYYSCWMRHLDAIGASAEPRFPESPCHSQIGDLSDSDKSPSAIPLLCSAWGGHFVRLGQNHGTETYFETEIQGAETRPARIRQNVGPPPNVQPGGWKMHGGGCRVFEEDPRPEVIPGVCEELGRVLYQAHRHEPGERGAPDCPARRVRPRLL